MPAKKPDYSFTEIKNIEGALSEITFMPSTLENIDQALFSFLNEDLDLYTTTNKGRIKVPIVWVSSERAFQIKNNQDLRDVNGSLKLPILTIERTSAVKDPSIEPEELMYLLLELLTMEKLQSFKMLSQPEKQVSTIMLATAN